jgi:hypothetical protein
MTKRKKILSYATVGFALTEIALGIILQTAGGDLTKYTRFSAVVLACLFCILFAARQRDYLLTQVAFICTVCADYFLIMTPVLQQLPAMLFFSVTQIAYFLRIYLNDESKSRRTWHIALRASLSVIAVTATLLILGSAADAVAVVSMFYYANLITNVIFSFINFKSSPVLAVGLLLFSLCDAVIGLDFLDGYISVASNSFIYKIIHPGFDLAWAFYLPAQTLLALSLLKPSAEKNRKS